MSLYTDLVAAGIELSNWRSDLYFPVTPETTAILQRHPQQLANATIFTSNIDKRRMYDVPFNYEPYWEKRS